MIILLFIFEIILIILTVFTTCMIEHKFNAIHASLNMYCNKRTYKTKSDVEFIETIINEYKRLCSDTDEEPDLSSAVSLKLHKTYIGRFAYISIKNIAIKARHLMWGIFVAEILLASINQVAEDGATLVIIFSSLILTVIMCFYGIIKGIDEKQETLIDEVTHYVRNVYPMEVKKKENTKSFNSDDITSEIIKYKEEESVIDIKEPLEVDKSESIKVEKKEKSQEVKGLTAQDIAQLLDDL